MGIDNLLESTSTSLYSNIELFLSPLNHLYKNANSYTSTKWMTLLTQQIKCETCSNAAFMQLSLSDDHPKNYCFCCFDFNFKILNDDNPLFQERIYTVEDRKREILAFYNHIQVVRCRYEENMNNNNDMNKLFLSTSTGWLIVRRVYYSALEQQLQKQSASSFILEKKISSSQARLALGVLYGEALVGFGSGMNSRLSLDYNLFSFRKHIWIRLVYQSRLLEPVYHHIFGPVLNKQYNPLLIDLISHVLLKARTELQEVTSFSNNKISLNLTYTKIASRAHEDVKQFLNQLQAINHVKNSNNNSNINNQELISYKFHSTKESSPKMKKDLVNVVKKEILNLSKQDLNTLPYYNNINNNNTDKFNIPIKIEQNNHQEENQNNNNNNLQSKQYYQPQEQEQKQLYQQQQHHHQQQQQQNQINNIDNDNLFSSSDSSLPLISTLNYIENNDNSFSDLSNHLPLLYSPPSLLRCSYSPPRLPSNLLNLDISSFPNPNEAEYNPYSDNLNHSSNYPLNQPLNLQLEEDKEEDGDSDSEDNNDQSFLNSYPSHSRTHSSKKSISFINKKRKSEQKKQKKEISLSSLRAAPKISENFRVASSIERYDPGWGAETPSQNSQLMHIFPLYHWQIIGECPSPSTLSP